MNNTFFFLSIAFLNAFVDIGHKITMQNVIFKEYAGSEQIMLIAAINAMIILPFVLLFSPSGFLSDKFPKNHIVKYGALAAVFITIAIFFSYVFNYFWVAFILTFLLAIQSAIYGPAKLGYIRDLVAKEKISSLNSFLQSVSMIGILSSMALFSFLFEQRYVSELGLFSLQSMALLLVFISTLEYAFARRLPTKTSTRDINFSIKKWISLNYLKTSFSEFKSNKTVFQSMIGLAIYWLIIQVMAVVFPAYAKSIGIENVMVINGMLACTGIGVFLGSLMYYKISKNFIEVGTIPLGALGVALSVYFISTTTNDIVLFGSFLLAGISGGIFVVPLNSLIQFNTKEDRLGVTMAGANLIQSLLMLVGLIVTTIAAYYGFSSQVLMYTVGIIAIVSAIYTVYQIPQSMIQFLIGSFFHFKYRLQVKGINNIPSTGPVLFLGNHVSWIDWAIIQMSSPRRIKFLMDKSIYEKWYLTKFLDFFGVVPIAGGNKDSLKKIASYLDNGEVVCIFPEGMITRNGQLSEFKKGFEKVLDLTTTDVSVIPFYIRGLWGDKFSRAENKFKENWNSKDLTVVFGEKVKDPTADNVKQAVFNLSTDSWNTFAKTFKPVHISILERLKEVGPKFIVGDTTGANLTGNKFLTASIMFSKYLKLKGNNIGVLLPSTSAGMIINTSILMQGKTIINLNYTAPLEALQASVKSADIKTIIVSRKFISKLKNKGFDLESLLENKNVIYVEDVKDKMTKAEFIAQLLAVKILPASILKLMYFKPVKMTDTAVILFSSGSEGLPKGVELSHENIIGNIKQIVNVLNPNKEDSILGILPMFHAFGITVTTLLPLVEGIPVISHPDPTDGRTIARIVAEYRISIMAATSTFLRIYTSNKRVHAAAFNSLRLVIAGAEKLDSNVRDMFEKKFKKEILEGYGATETSPVASVNVPDILTPDMTVQVGQKIGTVGLPIPGTTFKIVDPHDLEEFVGHYNAWKHTVEKTNIDKDMDKELLPILPTGEEGMILISGPQLMKGYLNNESKTNEVIVEAEGKKWYVTGDKGKIDADGFLTIVDRYSRFAKLAGEMISLTAVEQELAKIIKDIEYIVVAAPDLKKGEKLIFVYEGDINEKEIKSLMIKSIENNLMIPAELFQVEELPKLGTGKKDFKTAKSLYLDSTSS